MIITNYNDDSLHIFSETRKDNQGKEHYVRYILTYQEADQLAQAGLVGSLDEVVSMDDLAEIMAAQLELALLKQAGIPLQ